jgi:hypothetical protein
VGEREIHVEETSFALDRPSRRENDCLHLRRRRGRQVYLLPVAGGVQIRSRGTRASTTRSFLVSDGQAIVYVPNRGGKGALEIQPFHGGSPGEFCAPRRYRHRRRWAGSKSSPHPARVSILGADGRYHAPPIPSAIVSFTSPLLPRRGKLRSRRPRGKDHSPRRPRTETSPRDRRRGACWRKSGRRRRPSTLRRYAVLGFLLGDTHVHDLMREISNSRPRTRGASRGRGRSRERPHHVDGTSHGGRSRFVAGPHPASTESVLLRYGQEYG